MNSVSWTRLKCIAAVASCCTVLGACSTSGKGDRGDDDGGSQSPSMLIPMSTTDARTFLLDAFSPKAVRAQVESEFFQEHGFTGRGIRDERVVVVVLQEDSRATVNGGKLAGRPDGSARLYARPEAFYSDDYIDHGRPEFCTASFEVILEPEGSDATRVKVDMYDVNVYRGYTFSAHVMGFVPKPVPVAAGARDRAKLLKLIDHLLVQGGIQTR